MYVRLAFARGGAPGAGDPDRGRGAGGRRRGLPEEVPGQDGRHGPRRPDRPVRQPPAGGCSVSVPRRCCWRRANSWPRARPGRSSTATWPARRNCWRCALADRPDHIGRQRLRFTDTWVEDHAAAGCNRSSRSGGEAGGHLRDGPRLRDATAGFSFALFTPQGDPVTQFANVVSGRRPPRLRIPAKGCALSALIPRLPLNVGRYVFNVRAATDLDGEYVDSVPNAGCLDVEQGDYFGSGKLCEPKFLLLMDHSWTLSARPDSAVGGPGPPENSRLPSRRGGPPVKSRSLPGAAGRVRVPAADAGAGVPPRPRAGADHAGRHHAPGRNVFAAHMEYLVAPAAGRLDGPPAGRPPRPRPADRRPGRRHLRRRRFGHLGYCLPNFAGPVMAR